ncbi:MAG: hypothetical protein FJX89_01800 [Bacteroidetes bacterium]|nr:hypothetical protein [Bacteroidota bacterium]
MPRTPKSLLWFIRHSTLAGVSSFFLLAVLMASCEIEKPIGYFANGMNLSAIDTFPRAEQPIQQGDLLNITFFSDNPDATSIYNQVMAGTSKSSVISSSQDNARSPASSNAGGVAGYQGYRVDQQGNIRIHGLGLVHTEGMIRSELERHLTEKITALGVLSNPYCVVQNVSIRITVLGQVNAPGVFQTQNNRVTVFDAIALAGDILPTGRKQDVVLIREKEGKRSYVNLDLTNQDIFRSPNFILQQNDLLVVQANRLQMAPFQNQRQQGVNIILSFASILTILLNFLINSRI